MERANPVLSPERPSGPSGPEPALEVRGARKRFGSVTALDGVDLTLGRGEWLGLLGPNGAGKTTLMGAIAGLVELDEGSVRITGSPAVSRRGGDLRLRLGIVPQDVAVYRSLTARENLEVFGRLFGVDRRALPGRVAWALHWTALEDRADRRVDTFSGGMKRRLNIACGVLHRPEVILLDEPTVGVDPQSRHRIRDMLRELIGFGASLIVSSHQLDEIEAVCDRIVILDRGRVVASGTARDLIGGSVLRGRTVRLTVDRAVDPGLLGPPFDVTGQEVRGTLTDVADELPALLRRLASAGLQIRDLHVESPRLEEVFTDLTGRELRE